MIGLIPSDDGHSTRAVQDPLCSERITSWRFLEFRP